MLTKFSGTVNSEAARAEKRALEAELKFVAALKKKEEFEKRVSALSEKNTLNIEGFTLVAYL